MFFFFIPVGVEYQARRYPVVTFSLIGLNILIFLTWFVGRVGGAWEWEGGWYQNLWLIPATSSWYSWLTAMFVHAGFMHLIGNMIYLFLFGSPIEDMMGRWQFLLFYLVGGVIANFTYVAFIPDHFESFTPMGGASGAISACMGAFALVMLKSKIEFKWFFFFLFRFASGEFFLPTWLVMSFWFLRDVLGALLASGNHRGGVAFGAHVGGFIGGLLMILLVKWLWSAGLMRRANEADDDDEPAAPAVRVIAKPELPVLYIADQGNQTGPFTKSQVREMVRSGSISPEAWYWCNGMGDWQSVADLNPRA